MDKTNLVILDGDTIVYIATYNRDDEELTPNKVINNCNSVFTNLMKNTNSTKYCGFLTEGKSFRSKVGIIKEYKGNRKDFVKPKYYNLCKAWLYDVLNFEFKYNYEADDLCIMAHNSLKDIYNPIICSPDKDLRQVPGNFYDYKYNKSFTINEQEANYNFWFQVLVGDIIDNISGCKNIGKSKANVLLSNIQNPWALRIIVFDQYIKTYGEYQGIINFTENYRLCKMLDKTLEGELFIPDIYEYERSEKEDIW